MDNVILAPPLVIDAAQVGEMIAILGDSLEALSSELDLPVNR
jgi:adenosylmethionine-8-amino-7-oxononanoate aminotransferase